MRVVKVNVYQYPMVGIHVMLYHRHGLLWVGGWMDVRCHNNVLRSQHSFSEIHEQ